MTSYRNELLARLIAMEHEALDAYVAAQFPERTGIDAVPTLFYNQSSTPYIVHRVGRSTPSSLSEDASNRDYQIGIRLVIGHLTANYVGRTEEETNEILPLFEDYLIKHMDLTTDPDGTYPDPPTWLWPENIVINDTTGIVAFDVGGIKSQHVGEELLITVPVWRTTSNS